MCMYGKNKELQTNKLPLKDTINHLNETVEGNTYLNF